MFCVFFVFVFVFVWQPVPTKHKKQNKKSKYKHNNENAQKTQKVYGKQLIRGAVLLEFLGAILIVQIFIWQNFALLLPTLSNIDIVLICVGAALPTTWILNFSDLSFISFLGFLSTCLIAVTVTYNFAINFDKVM